MTAPAAPDPAPEGPILRVRIPGPPFALKRPRFSRGPGFVRTFDPKENVSWKATASALFGFGMAQSGYSGPFPFPIRLTVTAKFLCPKTDERKRDPRPERWSMSQKDADNILKAVGDAGNGVLWLDDRQIVDARVMKRIAAQGEPPETVVEVEGA